MDKGESEIFGSLLDYASNWKYRLIKNVIMISSKLFILKPEPNDYSWF